METESPTIAEVAHEIKSRKISPLEVTQFYLERIARLNPSLNAYITVTAEQALAAAIAAARACSAVTVM